MGRISQIVDAFDLFTLQDQGCPGGKVELEHLVRGEIFLRNGAVDQFLIDS